MSASQQVDSRTKSVRFTHKPSEKPSSHDKKEEKKREKELKHIAKKLSRTRDYLLREEKFNQTSIQRAWKEWEQWCEAIKVDELKEDLIVWSQSVNELLDRTQNAMETIKNHRAHAEDQYMRSFRNHSELINYLMDLYKFFHNASREMYESERGKLIAAFYNEAYKRDTLHYHQRKVYYENFAHAAVSVSKCRIYQAGGTFIERKVEIESTSVVKRGELDDLAMKRESIACSEISNLVNLFNTQLWPKIRFDEYQETLKKSLEVDKIIEELGRRIESDVKTISKLDEKLRSISREHSLKIAELKSEQQFLTKIMQQVQEKIKKECSMDQAKTVHLAATADKIEANLKKKLHHRETIETAAKICFKFEKFIDKLESFDDENLDFPTAAEDAFMQKVSRVEAQCVLLRAYKADLFKQNERLKAEIKEKSHEFNVNQNSKMLRLDSTPAVGQIVEVSHQISQIKTSINLRKQYELCRNCDNHFSF